MTASKIAGRYAPTYREAELHLICRSAQQGRSLAFVGVSGVGKSNLVNFLSEGGPAATGLLKPGEQVYFAVAACNRWQNTPASLWELLIQALERVPDFPAPPANAVLSLNDETRNLRRVRAWAESACDSCRLVFVLDHFDKVLQRGPLPMLEELAALRTDGNRDRLSYVVFTNRLPHVLGRSYNLEHESKFYDLLRRDVYALEPYQPQDALAMLAQLDEGCEPALTHRELHAIYTLAGGHAGLLAAVFGLWAERKAARLALPATAEELGAVREVRDACETILLSLHAQEQAALLRIARDELHGADLPTAEHLVRRGILKSIRPATLFCPIFAAFLQHHQREGEPT